MSNPTSRTLSVHVNVEPRRVYDFVRDATHLPIWAGNLCTGVEPSGAGWTLDTPRGPVALRFAPENPFGVLDHTVTVAPGVEVYVPMRVVPHESGSEVLFTLLRSPGVTDEAFAQDAALVEADLAVLKRVLER